MLSKHLQELRISRHVFSTLHVYAATYTTTCSFSEESLVSHTTKHPCGTETRSIMSKKSLTFLEEYFRSPSKKKKIISFHSIGTPNPQRFHFTANCSLLFVVLFCFFPFMFTLVSILESKLFHAHNYHARI